MLHKIYTVSGTRVVEGSVKHLESINPVENVGFGVLSAYPSTVKRLPSPLLSVWKLYHWFCWTSVR